MHLDSKLEMEKLAREKFSTLQWLAYSLFVAILLSVIGAVMSYLDSQPHSKWSLLSLSLLYPFGYGANEVLKVLKLRRHGWFLCYDCRRAISRKKMCVSMEGGVMKEICTRCKPHLRTEGSLKSKRPVKSFVGWLQGTLRYKKVDSLNVEPVTLVVD